MIHDEQGYHAHLDYLHFIPVRYGHISRLADWTGPTFQTLPAREGRSLDGAGSALADALWEME